MTTSTEKPEPEELHEPPGIPSIPAARVRTLAEVAEAFTVSRRTPTRWKADGCRELAAPPYDLRRVQAWLDEREENRTAAGRPSPKASSAAGMTTLKRAKLEAEIERIGADVRIREVQANILERPHYSRELVEGMFVERARAMRAGLDLVDTAATAEIVALVSGAALHRDEIEQAIRRELDNLYAALASEDIHAALEDRRRQLEAGRRVQS